MATTSLGLDMADTFTNSDTCHGQTDRQGLSGATSWCYLLVLGKSQEEGGPLGTAGAPRRLADPVT